MSCLGSDIVGVEILEYVEGRHETSLCVVGICITHKIRGDILNGHRSNRVLLEHSFDSRPNGRRIETKDTSTSEIVVIHSGPIQIECIGRTSCIKVIEGHTLELTVVDLLEELVGPGNSNSWLVSFLPGILSEPLMMSSSWAINFGRHI